MSYNYITTLQYAYWKTICGKESVIIPMQLFNKNIVLSYNLNYFTTHFDEREAQHIK